MFNLLTDAERDKLAAKLTSAYGQLAGEFNALDHGVPAVWELYQVPASGISAWLASANDCAFLAREVRTGQECTRPEYWIA